jgi:hypothetical protein
MPSGTERIVVIKPGEYPVGNLLNNEFLIALPCLAPPEDPVRVPFHVIDVALGMLVLVFTEFDSEACPYFLCIHNK